MTCIKILFLVSLFCIVQLTLGIHNANINIAGKTLQGMIKNDMLSLIKIPDYKIKKGKVTSIKIVSLTLPDVKITERGTTLTVQISNFGVKLEANWRVKFKIVLVSVKGKGTLKASANGVGITITLSKTTLQVIRCSDVIKKLDVDFKGKNFVGKVLTFITKTFKKRVIKFFKRQLKGKICAAVRRLIDSNAAKIAKILGITLKPRPIARPRPTPFPRPTPRPNGVIP